MVISLNPLSKEPTTVKRKEQLKGGRRRVRERGTKAFQGERANGLENSPEQSQLSCTLNTCCNKQMANGSFVVCIKTGIMVAAHQPSASAAWISMG